MLHRGFAVELALMDEPHCQTTLFDIAHPCVLAPTKAAPQSPFHFLGVDAPPEVVLLEVQLLALRRHLLVAWRGVKV